MNHHLRNFLTVVLLALALSLAACAQKSSPQPAAADQAGQPVATAAQPAANPAANGTNADKTVSCAQLVPPDELNLLVNQAAATLTETKNPGSTTCLWQYTPKGAVQASTFEVQVNFGKTAVQDWESARKAEIANEPADTAVISIDQLGNENYTWNSSLNKQSVVYVRSGEQTLVMRYKAADILFLQTESGIIDMADRIFNRLSS